MVLSRPEASAMEGTEVGFPEEVFAGEVTANRKARRRRFALGEKLLWMQAYDQNEKQQRAQVESENEYSQVYRKMQIFCFSRSPDRNPCPLCRRSERRSEYAGKID